MNEINDTTSQPADQPTLDELLDKLPEIRSKITADFMGRRPTALMVDIADLDTLLSIIDKLLAANDSLGSDLTQANIDYMQVTNGGRDLSGYDERRPTGWEYETYLVKATDSRRDDQKFYVEVPAALDVDGLDHYIQGVTRNLYPGAVVRAYYWIKTDAAAASNGDGEARDD